MNLNGLVSGKYIFLDIVSYSIGRTIEAQTEIIGEMNRCVREVFQFFNINNANRILIPTGDGICIALLEIDYPFDIHIKMALEILRLIEEHNQSCADNTRKFKVRIGINENIDNLIIDVNGNKNIAGAGINEAQRIMNQGDENNIFISRAVYDRLKQRESYSHKFKTFNVVIKYGVTLDVYQYIDPSAIYLNSNEPKSLGMQKEFDKEKRFSMILAYFIGYLIKNKEFVISNAGEPRNNFALFVLISYLAKDSVERSKLGRFEQHYSGLPKGSIQEQFDYFMQIHFDLLMDYVKMFFEIEIEPYSSGDVVCPIRYFTKDGLCLVPDEEAIVKLRQEWPGIIEELGI